MPTYLYRCEADHITSRYDTIRDHPERVVCAECGKSAERVISAPMLKHDGAYSYDAGTIMRDVYDGAYTQMPSQEAA